MKPQPHAKLANISGYTLVPPPNFGYAEENISRCSFPLARNHISFLQSIGVGHIINLSSKKIDAVIQGFCDEKGIEIENILQENESPPFGQVASLESWIATVVQIVIEKAYKNLVLIVGSSDTFYDCLIVACLRRIQEWSYVSILAEFRQFTWPYKLLDFEQLIEVFNTSSVDLSAGKHDFLAIHENFKEEEDKLVSRHRLAQSSKSESQVVDEDALSSATISSEADEQARIDAILHTLFFSPKNHIISEGTTYDPSVSLINDKDEED